MSDGMTPDELADALATDPPAAIITRSMWDGLQARIADLSHALEMEHQLLGEARLQIEERDQQLASAQGVSKFFTRLSNLYVNNATLDGFIASFATDTQAERVAWMLNNYHARNHALHERIAARDALLAQCLAALVCMQGEYQNEPLIEAVRAALGVKA